MSSRRDLDPLEVRFAVRDAMGGWGPYSVNEIAELFQIEGFNPDLDHMSQASGARRAEVEQHHAGIDFRSREQCERYLRVIERVLDDLSDDQWKARRERLTRSLDRAGIVTDERGRLQLPAAVLATARLVELPTSSGIRLHAERLDRLDQEPEELIGAAKELVEATAKYVLAELGDTIGDAEDVGALSKRALARLKLHPTSVAPTTKGAEPMIRLLGGLAQVPGALAELRNLGYGTGHGHGSRVAGLQRRHAEFIARAAVAYATFVLDTFEDPAAPWRESTETLGWTSAEVRAGTAVRSDQPKR